MGHAFILFVSQLGEDVHHARLELGWCTTIEGLLRRLLFPRTSCVVVDDHDCHLLSSFEPRDRLPLRGLCELVGSSLRHPIHRNDDVPSMLPKRRHVTFLNPPGSMLGGLTKHHFLSTALLLFRIFDTTAYQRSLGLMGCAASSAFSEHDTTETNELVSYDRRVLLKALATPDTSPQGSANDIPSIPWGDSEMTAGQPSKPFQLAEASTKQSQTFVKKKLVDSAALPTTPVPSTAVATHSSPAVGPPTDPSYLRSIPGVPSLPFFL